MKQRLLNLLVAVDQLAWVVCTLGVGYPDETISAALWRMEQAGRIAGRLLRPLVDAIFWFDPAHCYSAWLDERHGRQLPREYRP